MAASDARAPLRVAQLVETLAMGGAERLAVQIAGARAEAGDHSLILVLGGPGPLAAQVDPRVGVRYLQLERASITRPLRFLASLRHGSRALREEVRREGLQIVQSHLPNANFWGLLLALRDPVAVIPTVHNNNEFYYGEMTPPRVRSRLRRLAYRAMLRRCAAVVAVSEQVARSLLREVGARGDRARRLRVVPNGVAIPAAPDPAAVAAIRARFGCRDGEILVLAAGRHSEQKNFQALIAAAAVLRGRGAAFRMVIAGEGERRDAHQAQVASLRLADRVLLPGNVSDLTQVMQAADAFALPSLWEGLPLVLLEALAAGAPVVGSDIDGVREVIADGETGLLCAADDPGALADALLRLQDPALRARLRSAGLALVRRTYAFERVNAQLDDLYRSVVRGGPSTRPAPRA